MKMNRVLRGAAVTAGLLVVAGSLHAACAEAPYLGGECEVDDDCNSEYQVLPGSGCISGLCQCLDPRQHACCAKGDEDNPRCFIACRYCEECVDGTEGCPAVSGCQSDADCPGPPDARCGVGRCVEGECTVEIQFGPLTSQLRGDCQRVECTTSGELVTIEDVGDYYDDGKQCTYDTCGPNGPSNAPLASGLTCPSAGSGRCVDGKCVECWASDPSMNDCGLGLACDGIYCVPMHCTNFQPDPGETDVDCGASCQPCPAGHTCAVGTDCKDGVCIGGLCKLPTCTDGVKNDAESGVDCGGASSCARCPTGQGCELGADCKSGVCWSGLCEEASCFDGVQNAAETGIDCGPGCELACP